jgi:hypothetical protein
MIETILSKNTSLPNIKTLLSLLVLSISTFSVSAEARQKGEPFAPHMGGFELEKRKEMGKILDKAEEEIQSEIDRAKELVIKMEMIILYKKLEKLRIEAEDFQKKGQTPTEEFRARKESALLEAKLLMEKYK